MAWGTVMYVMHITLESHFFILFYLFNLKLFCYLPLWSVSRAAVTTELSLWRSSVIWSDLILSWSCFACLDPQVSACTFLWFFFFITSLPAADTQTQTHSHLIPSLFHPSGSVICDACSLAAEGETDIQENFCRSPYGEISAKYIPFFFWEINFCFNIKQATGRMIWSQRSRGCFTMCLKWHLLNSLRLCRSI